MFRLEDRKYTEGVSALLVKAITDKIDFLLHNKAVIVSSLDFYGHDFGMGRNSRNGILDKDILSDEDAAKLIQSNLIVKEINGYQLNFACFTETQFEEFISLFDIEDAHLDALLVEWIVTVRKNFAKFVPARLDNQINQWVSGYLFQIVGYVVDELIRRGTLRKPDMDRPLTDGVFYVAGKYIDP